MASETIKGLIVVPPREALHKYQNTHTQLLTLLLRCAPEGLAFFARLLDIATQHDDFEVSDQRKLVHHQSFFKCLTEVLQATCATFTFASENTAEIQRATLQLQEAVVSLVDNAGDEDLRTETIKAMSDAATIGVSLARQIGDKFHHVRLMLEEMTAHFTSVKGTTEGDPTNPVEIELLQTTKKFQYVESGWTEIVDMLARVDSDIKADLVEDPSAKSGTDKVTMNIAKNAVATTTSAALVATVITGFYEMSKKYLDEPVAEFCKIEADAKHKDEFTRLENKFWDTHAGIEQLINTARDSWSQTRTKIVEQLKQGFEATEEQKEKFYKLMALYESANKMVDQHGKLEALLNSSPEGIRLLGQLCLVSTKHKDFPLYKPLKPFNHVKYDRFRACLHQVVNRGSESFTSAHKELSVIETHARDVQALIVDIVELILQGTPDDIKAQLPDKLKFAREKGSECGKKSAEVEKKFDAVIHLVNELSEALTATSSDANKKASESGAAATPTIECQEVIKALRDGLFVLTGVRKQWTLLTQFFTGLANNMIKIQINDPMGHFTASASVAGENGMNKKLTNYARETLQGQASDIIKMAFQVNMICSTYLQISKKHLLEPLSKVDALLALTDAEQIESALQAISITCGESETAIKDRAATSRTKMLIEFKSKMEELAEMCEEQGTNCEKEEDYDYGYSYTTNESEPQEEASETNEK